MKTIKRILILSGVLLILAAAALCVYNIIQDKRAYNKSQEVMSELIDLIPEPKTTEEPADAPTNPADDLFAPYEQDSAHAEDMPVPISVEGRDYCGYITLPALELELPVIDSWSYDALNVSPCRFSGTVSGNDLIIAAHNYNSHFGLIAKLNDGDDILFTDTSGNVNRYRVDEIRVLDGSDSEGMFFGKGEEWDITLFTCTLSGQSRVAVRGCRTDKTK